MKRILILLFLFLISCKETNVSVVEFESHHIQLNINVDNHSAKLSDSGKMRVSKGWNLFTLNGFVDIHSFNIDDILIEYQSFSSKEPSNIPIQFRDKIPSGNPHEEEQIIAFQSKSADIKSFSISYSGTFYENVEDVHFSNENVGREVTATISEQGAYFSPAATYYPMGNESMASFKLTANIPEIWESISDGNRLSNETKNGRKIQSWGNPFKNDGNMFMAAPFVTKSTWVDDIEVACYFFEADTGLFDQYLPATAGYIRQYSELIGPYPYERFTVVENFFPTGYGMPAWTLLGQQVIRLPFIVFTSLGHEVLHNWWGNSVYVDYDRGNWCESATVYGADYRYKLKRSPDAAKTYRKDILKQYVNYVTEENDFPIRKFVNRTSPETRTIGYNKAMMVYHMIEEEIGTEPFFDAWKLVNTKHQEQRISWEEWVTAFEETSGKDLNHIIPQWINQEGAPILDLKINDASDDFIDFTLFEKSGQNYRLEVPIHFDSGFDTTVVLSSPSSTFSMKLSKKANSISVDPDLHLFRRLYPVEIEPILSAALGNKNKLFFTNDNPEHFQTFGNNVTESDVTILTTENISTQNKTSLPIILNLKELPVFLTERIQVTDETITIGGKDYPKSGHTFILTGKNWNGFKNMLAIVSSDLESLPRIGQLVPHYGKYSYLVFKGSKNVGKGQWAVGNSPLIKSLNDDGVTGVSVQKVIESFSPAFSADRMMEAVNFLADDKLKGRGIGTQEIDMAANYIANKFEEYGLKPGSDEGSFFQKWTQDVLDKKEIKLQNVIGLIPGKNTNLSEAVVISAHYDHLGTGWPNVKKGNNGKIHNGADDNASGVSVMLELAKIFGELSKPSHTIIFVAFTAEESGLVGSRYFVNNYKKYSFSANLNIDTVGRLFDNKLMVLNSNSAAEWKYIFMGIKYSAGIETAIIPQDLDASDQMAFIEKRIPGVQLFYSGIGSDYHVPEDDAHKIDPAGLVKAATVSYEVLKYLAGREEPMAFKGTMKDGHSQSPSINKKSGERKASTGIMPDFTFSGLGVKISGLSEDSPASKSGLLLNDIIIKFDGKTVNNLKEYSNLLKEHKPGDTVTFTIEREGKKEEINLTLSER